MSIEACVKICGLSRMADIVAVNDSLPDYVGFVMVPSSKRFVDISTAAKLIKALNKNIASVAVFVDEPIESVLRTMSAIGAKIAQLHGKEDDEYIKMVQSAGYQVIKAYNIVDRLPKMTQEADYTLLDGAKAGGGMPFDWRKIQDVDLGKVFIAGGINIDNINQALGFCPYGIDVSGGVESNGRKDPYKINTIVKAVRAYELEQK